MDVSDRQSDQRQEDCRPRRNTTCGKPGSTSPRRCASAARMGLNEGVCNHFSMELPGEPDKFLINPQGFHWSEITPADLMVVDENGNVLEGKHKVEPTAFFIHGRIHLRCKKKVVLHTPHAVRHRAGHHRETAGSIPGRIRTRCASTAA